ncbi:MAG TPA: response regulator [Verrucomicrobiae bacterium]|nr:response regulator [Verrucomicrobiae bacterium]
MTPSRILLVEDDENDVFLMERALTKAKLAQPMHVAVNGREALDYLSGSGRFGDRSAHPLPNCVFLGLKLPYVHGFEVLEWMRNQSLLGNISVFVLTSSPEDRDRERAMQLGATEYLLKPPTPEMLQQVFTKHPHCGGRLN